MSNQKYPVGFRGLAKPQSRWIIVFPIVVNQCLSNVIGSNLASYDIPFHHDYTAINDDVTQWKGFPN